MYTNRTVLRLSAAATVLVTAIACGEPSAPARVKPGESSTSKTTAGVTYNNFYNVQVQRDGFTISVYFQYIGKGAPILSVGKTPSVFSNLTAWVPAKNMNNGYWYAHVTSLLPGELYYYRLDDLQSTWSDSVRTYRRHLIVDLDRVHVNYDADPGPGCGEFIFRTEFWGNGHGSEPYTKWHDLCSGDDLYLSDAEGRTVYPDWKWSPITVWPKLFEGDACSIWWDFECGERGWTDAFLKYDVSGGPKSYTFIVSSAPQNTPKVVWYGTVKTTFAP